MKLKIVILNILLVGMTALYSCQQDDEQPVLTNIQASELDYLPFNTFELQEPEGDANPLLFTVTWSETQFFLDNASTSFPAGPVSYTLEMDVEGNDFNDAVALAATTNLFADILVVDLNTVLLNNFGAVPGTADNYELRVIAAYGGSGSPAHQVVSVNTLPTTITPYFPPKDIEPLYIIGDMQSAGYEATAFMMYRNSSSNDDYTYTYTGRFDGGTHFKLAPESELSSGKFYYAGNDGELLFGDAEGGDFYIETEGYYTLNINVETMTWSIEAYDASEAAVWTIVNFVGQFSNWGADNEPNMVVSAYDPHQWTLDINLENIDYGVKFRTNNSWDNRWCPQVPTDSPYGIADFNPTGHDNNIDLAEQGLGHYHVRLNDLTGHYVVLIQE
ncbi:SusF/SusE family outer membrane protein [Carboxylicivirga sp. A043]|uniref:SusE domain-containing protein n=1 Tax=Carboxylicivirga litoralis TaxID=2816963 RepID=UPI0021CB50DD|nr:SusE domain-containing protein [Carboxylicivirga sp. A043]MCU4155650.1 SusF/SusE family outer membrane protein [Carboxylicivirga sp. A043]